MKADMLSEPVTMVCSKCGVRKYAESVGDLINWSWHQTRESRGGQTIIVRVNRCPQHPKGRRHKPQPLQVDKP